MPCGICGTVNRVDLARLANGPRCGSCGKPLHLDRPLPVGDANLEKVVEGSEVPVLVDFWADWCAPCKAMAPVLDELARERTGRLVVAKLDTDRNPAMAVRFAIRGIPTLILFRDGREVARQSGALPRQRLDAFVDAAGERGR